MESLRATLRQVTLSLDSPNKVIPLASHPTNGLVLHYTAQTQVTAGETPAWSAEVYVNPANDAQCVEVSANGTLRYMDVSQGSQGYRWDAQTDTYAIGPRNQFSGEMNPDKNGNQNVTQIFRDPYTLLQNGLLWYSGTAKMGETNVYDYILVSAPNRTDVYIDQNTKQVVKLDVDTKTAWNVPFDRDQVFGRDSARTSHSSSTCSRRTFRWDVLADTPSNSHQDQGHVPTTVTCS